MSSYKSVVEKCVEKKKTVPSALVQNLRRKCWYVFKNSESLAFYDTSNDDANEMNDF